MAQQKRGNWDHPKPARTDLRRLTACPHQEVQFPSDDENRFAIKEAASRTFPCATIHGFTWLTEAYEPTWSAHEHRLATFRNRKLRSRSLCCTPPSPSDQRVVAPRS